MKKDIPSPKKSADSNQSFNERKYTSFNLLRRLLLNRFLEKVWREIEKQKPKEILDVGCGEGQADRFFLRKNPELKILGVDKNMEALRKAKFNCPLLKTQKANAYHLSFPDCSFDLVLCLEVLEHLDRPEKALEEIKRVGNCRFILSVPHEPLFSWTSFLSGKYLKNLGRHPEHVHFWSKKEFKKLLGGFFGKARVEPCFPWLIGIVES